MDVVVGDCALGKGVRNAFKRVLSDVDGLNRVLVLEELGREMRKVVVAHVAVSAARADKTSIAYINTRERERGKSVDRSMTYTVSRSGLPAKMLTETVEISLFAKLLSILNV